MAAGLRLSGQLQRVPICCGRPRSCWRDWRVGGDDHPRPPVADPPHGRTGLRTAGTHGAEPARGRDLHRRQRFASGAVLDPPGWRFHAWQSPADAVVLPAGTRRGDSVGAARRHPNGPWRRLFVCRSHQCVVAFGRRLVAVGGQFEWHGVRRHPSDVLRHRRRTPVLRAGHRQRAPADRRRLSRLPADACGTRRVENTPDGALLLPSGNYDQWDVVPAIPPPPEPRRPKTAKRVRTQYFSPTWACWG